MVEHGRVLALGALLLVYGLGLVRFPPRLTLSTDESLYVRQAVAYARAERTVEVRDPLTWQTRREIPSWYPPGVSLLQTPFVRIGGWPAAAWASFLGLVVLTGVTALWLARLRLPVGFAALVLLYPATAVLARTGMGDLPSAAVVAIAMFLLLGPGSLTPSRVALGGAVAGASLLFRDSTPVFLLPVLLGALIRGPQRALLVVMTVLGASARPVLAHVLQGDFLVLRTPYPFTIEGSVGRLLFYAMALCLFVPGGLLAVLKYRGERWREIQATVVAALGFFSLYSYSARDSGFLKSLVLGPRYLIPLLPLIAVALAWWVERVVHRPNSRRNLEWGVLIGSASVALAVHPVVGSWNAKQQVLVDALYRETSRDAVLITEPGATGKYVNELYGSRTYIDKLRIDPGLVRELTTRRPVQVVFIDRADSEYWKATTALNEEYVRDLQTRCVLRTRIDITSVDRLRVLDVESCRSAELR